MLRTTTTALIATTALGLGLLAMPPAHAADPTVEALDATGDVRILHPRDDTITTAGRRSIDIREVTITPRGDRTVRVSVAIKEALPGADFDQMVFLDIEPVVSSTEGWVSAAIGWSPQRPRKWGYASLELDGEDYRNCTPERIRTDVDADTLAADIPYRCVPSGPARIRVSTLTGSFRSDADVHSRDVLRIRGPHSLR
ncbi:MULTISPECIES: hypothetical protein [unclassified Nocardioides]|uniref:hypothetical protein n=1 Tax=unclassified Nocardioides TaxID=2615069 RepID=UPI00360D7B76